MSICAPVLAAALLAGAAATARDQGGAAEKAALEQHAAAVQASARSQASAYPKPVDAGAMRPRPVPAGPPPTGVVELPSPFPTREYVLQALGWQHVDADRRLTVYAGSIGDDPDQGMLVVVATTIPSNETQSTNVYISPTRHGALQVVEARGDVLLLRDEAGQSLSFDVSARRFL